MHWRHIAGIGGFESSGRLTGDVDDGALLEHGVNIQLLARLEGLGGLRGLQLQAATKQGTVRGQWHNMQLVSKIQGRKAISTGRKLQEADCAVQHAAMRPIVMCTVTTGNGACCLLGNVSPSRILNSNVA